ncbi:MAG: peptide chain release factor N(5)-glutamine methyltransferase [Balneolaceae bacterium]|nr:MAG: peptide chain release factor N(5)-glutamine methyltransferase [Balneolaceae bacterium]
MEVTLKKDNMNTDTLYNERISLLKTRLKLLEDKPEETYDSTLRALWFAACGKPQSAESAMMQDLPELNEECVTILDELIHRRINNIPLAHITNRTRFMGIEMKADKRALIPRKETEILSKRALEISFKFPDANVIDVCCGAGNVGAAIAFYNPGARVYVADLSSEAIELAQENIDLLDLNERVKVMHSDLFEKFMNDDFFQKVDLVTCNPPYISSFKVSKMNSEIAENEPDLAFDGGMLGIKIIQRLIRETPQLLSPGGWLVFEVGVGQGTMVMNLLIKSGLYSNVDSVSDNQGNIRVVLAMKK